MTEVNTLAKYRARRTMIARILTGSKEQIAEQLVAIQGEIREAIVLIDEPAPSVGTMEDIFAEMEPFTVHQSSVDDSRDAIYHRTPGE
jgi:hypothetical protein